jgi:glycosyltransferase involved in cell wall biosynthesis
VAPSVPTRKGKREGIPVVLMEAMASGVPVIASDLSGIPELVEDDVTGLLAPPRDSTAIAAALGRLHGDETLRRRLGAAGRERVERDFDVRRNALALARNFPAAVTG